MILGTALLLGLTESLQQPGGSPKLVADQEPQNTAQILRKSASSTLLAERSDKQ